MRNAFYIACLLLVPALVRSQTNSRMAKPDLQIGEQTEVIYEIHLSDRKDKVRFEPKMGLMPADVVLENSSLSSGKKANLEIIGDFHDSIAAGKQLKWIGKYKITAWDTGHFEIPAPRIILNDSTYDFQPIRFKVSAPKKIAGQGIYESEIHFTDIPYDSFYWLKKNWWWMASILVVLALYLVYRRNSRKLAVPEKKETSLKERTLLAIDALDAARLWEKGQLKEHYIEMSYILRSYLGVRYNLNLLERTSYQTTVLLITQGLPQDTVKTIQLILDQSDMVKFAKSAPTEMEIYKISALAKQIVAETSPIEFENV